MSIQRPNLLIAPYRDGVVIRIPSRAGTDEMQARKFREELVEAGQNALRIVLAGQDLQILSGPLISAILGAFKVLNLRPGDMVFSQLPVHVADMVKILRLEVIFPLCITDEEALAHVAEPMKPLFVESFPGRC